MFWIYLMSSISLLLVPKPETYIYELRLREAFQNKMAWSSKEHQIQQDHLSYLDSLTRIGKLRLGGILDQELDSHTGFVLLHVSNYEEAHAIALHDPAVEKGMMKAKIRTVNIYFEK